MRRAPEGRSEGPKRSGARSSPTRPRVVAGGARGNPVCLPSGGARPTTYTAPFTRTADPSSGRLSQVPTGGFPLTRAIAVAYSANWGAQVATISSTFPSLLPANLWSMTTRPSAVRMRRSILPTTRWPLSSLAETGYSAQRSLPGHVEEIHEKRALSETRRASASKEIGEACREKESRLWPVRCRGSPGLSRPRRPWCGRSSRALSHHRR